MSGAAIQCWWKHLEVGHLFIIIFCNLAIYNRRGCSYTGRPLEGDIVALLKSGPELAASHLWLHVHVLYKALLYECTRAPSRGKRHLGVYGRGSNCCFWACPQILTSVWLTPTTASASWCASTQRGPSSVRGKAPVGQVTRINLTLAKVKEICNKNMLFLFFFTYFPPWLLQI